MPAPAMHSSLSYDKWNKVGGDDSDDEPAPGAPLEAKLESKKQLGEIERDNTTHARMAAYHKEHMYDDKGKKNESLVPQPHVDLMARFIAICDRGKEQSNTYRYSEITRFCAQYRSTAFELPFINGMCELHRCIVDGSPDPKNAQSQKAIDTRLILEAINTLEACRRFDNVTLLFEMLCQPSMSERAKKVTEKYVKLDFGKRALLRHLFKASAAAMADLEDEQDLEYEALINPAAVQPGSSARRKPKAEVGPFGLGDEETGPWLACLGVAALIILLVGFYFFWTYGLNLVRASSLLEVKKLSESASLASSEPASGYGAAHDEV